jgi:TIR domain
VIHAHQALPTEADSGTPWPLLVGIGVLVLAVVLLLAFEGTLPWRRRPRTPDSPPRAPAAQPEPAPAAGPTAVPAAVPEAVRESSRPSARDGTSSGIFISYRRQDEPNFAGRLYDRLAGQFGREAVFMDVDTIDLGVDFAEVIDQSLARCRVMIVVIGRKWLGVLDEDGDRRLDSPDDYVRLEIEKGLHSDTRVIPVLVEGATTPKSTQLPPSLASLARRNGIAMAHASFTSDASRLIATLDRILAEPG